MRERVVSLWLPYRVVRRRFCCPGGLPHGGFDGDLFSDVDVFRSGFDAEGGVSPDAEFAAAFEPGGAEAVAVSVHGQHVGDEECAFEEFVDFAGGE